MCRHCEVQPIKQWKMKMADYRLHPGMKNLLIPLSEVVQLRGFSLIFCIRISRKFPMLQPCCRDSGQSLLQPCPENNWLLRKSGPAAFFNEWFKARTRGLIANCCSERSPLCCVPGQRLSKQVHAHLCTPPFHSSLCRQEHHPGQLGLLTAAAAAGQDAAALLHV